MTALPKPNNPLLGTPLHRALKCLEEIQQHIENDTRDDFEAARRLLGVSDHIAVALDEVKAELNRRYVELKRAEKARTTAPAKLVLKMPGRNAAPVLFDRTRRGIDFLLEFVADAMVDGGAGMVALNHELLDLIASKDKAWADEVAGLREAAMDALAPGAEDDG
jgi:hypothetical protein